MMNIENDFEAQLQALKDYGEFKYGIIVNKIDINDNGYTYRASYSFKHTPITVTYDSNSDEYTFDADTEGNLMPSITGRELINLTSMDVHITSLILSR